MVHSDSASPMKATPTASLQLTVTSSVPPQVPLPTVTAGQDLCQTPDHNLCTADAFSGYTQPTPAELHVVTPELEPAADSTSVPDWTSDNTPVSSRINGRTSGRKRTPKACDCCGPNSRGHDAGAPNRGHQRGRGRGRGRGGDHLEASKRKVDFELTAVKNLKLFRDESTNEGVQVCNSITETPVIPPVTLVEEPLRNCCVDKADPPIVIEEPETFEKSFLGTKCSSATDVAASPIPSSHVAVQPVLPVQPETDSGKSSVVNGSEAEKSKEEVIILNDSGNGTICSENPQDLDFLIDECTLIPLSNGVHNNDQSSSQPKPPPTSPIAVRREQHVWALSDHQLYCQTGTWEKEELPDVDVHTESREEQIEERLEQLIDMVHEFLESFYIKYGSFIPLSESDVLEYLKMKGNCEDLSNKGLNIKGEMDRYRTGLASAPFSGFMLMYNKHSLSLEDLGTLEDQSWVNDQIINMYGELIMEHTQHKVHFFNSFFHKKLVAKGYEGVKRWTKKVDLFSKWLVLIPIHLEIHWSLVTVTMATKTINYYDSQGIVFRNTTDNIMRYLQAEAREKKQTSFQKGWRIIINKNIPQQKNDSDCGVFVLEYCRCQSMKQPLLFSQEDMPRIRKRMYKELCDCRLLA